MNGLTWIIARRVETELRTGLAGPRVIFLRKIEAIDCHVQCGEDLPFGRQDLSAMVGMRSGHEEAVRR